jgi:CRP-like cAMP-binding protein
MVNNKELIKEIKRIAWFQELDDTHLNRIIEISHLVSFDSQQVIFSEGDREDFLYILLTGHVDLIEQGNLQNKTKIDSIEPSEILGWSSVAPVIRARTVTAIATSPTRAIAIDSVKLRELCDEDHEIGYTIYKHIANIVATRLLTTRMRIGKPLS